MHGNAPVLILAISLIATVPYSASATPLVGGAGLTAATETLSQVEDVHYYGYGRGYYGRGYYGGYGRGYYGGYGRGYYGGYGRGYGGYGRGYYGYRYY